MLRARLATAAVVIPLLLVLILAGPAWLFALVVAAIAVLGIGEYATMAFPQHPGQRWLTLLLGATVTIGAAVGQGHVLAAAVALTIGAGLVWTLVMRPDFEQGLGDLGLALVGILYVSFLAPHFIWLRAVEPDGPRWVIFVLAVGMLGDTAGYFVGHRFGRHKLMPRVSPGKTVEGAIGILLASLAAGAAAKPILLQRVSWTELLVLAVTMGVLGQLGDLSESIMKRTFQAKESGWLFPGHGGVLDRLDSLLFPVAVLYYHLIFSR